MSSNFNYDDVLSVQEDEKGRRLLTSGSVQVIAAADDPALDRLFTPGTATILMAPSGDPTFAEACDCATGRNQDADRIGVVLREQFVGRKRIPTKDAAQLLRSEPTIGQILLGRFTLADGLFVPPDMKALYASLPYNGGSLDGVSVSLLQYHLPVGPQKHYEAALILRAPQLTPAETAALEKVPADQFDMNVGAMPECWRYTAFGIAFVVIAATIGCEVLPIFASALTNETIARLGPELTARELVNVRRQAIKKQMK